MRSKWQEVRGLPLQLLLWSILLDLIVSMTWLNCPVISVLSYRLAVNHRVNGYKKFGTEGENEYRARVEGGSCLLAVLIPDSDFL